MLNMRYEHDVGGADGVRRKASHGNMGTLMTTFILYEMDRILISCPPSLKQTPERSSGVISLGDWIRGCIERNCSSYPMK